MPEGDPRPAIVNLLKVESAIRLTGKAAHHDFMSLPPYWADLARLLQVFRHHKEGQFDLIPRVRDEMTTDVYDPFITKRYEDRK
jgi:thymidylate synthase